MALLFMDGFEAADAAAKWDIGSNSATSTNTRFSSGRSYTVGGSSALRTTITPSAQVTMGTAWYQSNTGNQVGVLFNGDSGAVTHLTFTRNTVTGLFEVYRGLFNTLLATGTHFIPATTWMYIEFQATIADAGGTVIVRFNGNSTPEINFTGDTRNGGVSTNIDTIFYFFNLGGDILIDDVYILNSTGSSNTTFLGDVRVQTLAPTGDGASSQLTGSDGNSVANWQQVDEFPFSSADYNGSPTTGLRDSYAMSNLSASATQIFGVQNNIIAAKSDATAASAKSVLRTGGTNYYGTTQVLGTSYISYHDMYNTNPNTTLAWTPSDVDGVESGMEVA